MYPIPYKIAVTAAAVCLSVALSLIYGAYQYRKGYNAATAKISLEIAEKERKRAKQIQAASADYQRDKAAREEKERVQYVEVQKIIEKPVYHRDCLDADGLHELNRAIGGN